MGNRWNNEHDTMCLEYRSQVDDGVIQMQGREVNINENTRTKRSINYKENILAHIFLLPMCM